MDLTFITKWLDYIPQVVEFIRNLVTTILTTFNLPINPSYSLTIGLGALILAYYWIKQFITYGVFSKISTILNWILIALLIYITFVYV